MKKYLSFALSLLSIYCIFTFYQAYGQERIEIEATKPVILVSVPPYSSIVQQIVGSHAEVKVIVSSSLSSHTFEPTPQQTYACKDALIWFGIGEPFEAKMLASLKETLNSPIYYVNLKHEIQEQLDILCAKHPSLRQSCSCSHGGRPHHHHNHVGQIDPHIWMSSALMSLQTEIIGKIIKEKLMLKDVDVDAHVQKLKEACVQINDLQDKLLTPLHGKSIIVAHSAYGYLLTPYTIHQYSIEEEGKEPSPKAITKLIEIAKKEQVTSIFTQSQYPSKGASVIAQSLSKDADKKFVKIIELDPYGTDYFNNMKHIIETIAHSFDMPQSSKDEESAQKG